MSAARRPLIPAVIEQANPDEHVWITVNCEGRPTLSIDIGNAHGRRYMSVRLDGMTHHSMLLDTAHLPSRSSNDWLEHRFCPFCGDKIDFLSSRTHTCADSEGEA